MALTLDIVTPEHLAASQAVDMVVIPGEDGDFGVLEQHAPLISAVRAGVIRIYSGETVTERYLVTGGFAEVTGERCTILVPEIHNFTDVDREHFEARLQVVKRIHDKAQEEKDKELAARDVSLAEQALDAYIREIDNAA